MVTVPTAVYKWRRSILNEGKFCNNDCIFADFINLIYYFLRYFKIIGYIRKGDLFRRRASCWHYWVYDREVIELLVVVAKQYIVLIHNLKSWFGKLAQMDHMAYWLTLKKVKILVVYLQSPMYKCILLSWSQHHFAGHPCTNAFICVFSL